MTAARDWLGAILRPEPDEVDEATVPSFDGGARSPLPAPPVGMNVLIRRARFGDGTDARCGGEDE